jgi:hypothetical protein
MGMRNQTIERACGAVGYTSQFTNNRASWAQVAFQDESCNGSFSAWQEAIEQILRLRDLKDNWDGDAAAVPGIAVVDTAVNEAIRLRRKYHNPPDRVSAGVNGTVLIEWWLTDRTFEIEVVSPAEVEYRLGGVRLDHTSNSVAVG